MFLFIVWFKNVIKKQNYISFLFGSERNKHRELGGLFAWDFFIMSLVFNSIIASLRVPMAGHIQVHEVLNFVQF